MKLRQEEVIRSVAERIERSPDFEGALLIGSFAAGTADDLSDLDLIVVVREGRFEPAWAGRGLLSGPEALVAWDDVDPAHAEIGGHKWLTRDLVLVECLLATASSGVRLAEPHRLLVGQADLPERLATRPRFTREELDEFVQARAAARRIHEVEVAYSALARAVRSHLPVV